MDLTSTIAPRSDQLNADDLIPGPVTVTIASVSEGSAEQPVDVHLVEYPGRAYRPSKSMRRVMVAGWGKDSSAYTGRRLTLYRNPATKFGRDVVGGIEISHMSDLKDGKPLTIALTVTRGKRAPFTVNPLTASAPAAPTATSRTDDISTITDVVALKGMWRAADPERRALIEARVAELNAEPTP